MKLSVNPSLALLNLIQTNQVHVDAIEWVDKLGLNLIRQTRSKFPNLPFHFPPRGGCTSPKTGIATLRSIYLSVPNPRIFPSIWRLYPCCGLILPCDHISTFLIPTLRAPSGGLSTKCWLSRIVLSYRSFQNMPSLHPTRYC